MTRITMYSYKVFPSILAAGVLATLFAAGAHATILYDQNLTSGVYYGTGNPNGGFTVDNETNGVQIGLSARLSGIVPNPVIDSPTDEYDVPPGLRAGSVNHDAWNYDFSIDLGGSGLTISGITANLLITDLTTSASTSYSVLALPDNATQGNTGIQNSENPLFGGFVTGSTLASGYNPYATDTYQFVLTVLNATTGAPVGSDTILVSVTPEPSTIGFMVFGVAGLALLARRKARA